MVNKKPTPVVTKGAASILMLKMKIMKITFDRFLTEVGDMFSEEVVKEHARISVKIEHTI